MSARGWLADLDRRALVIGAAVVIVGYVPLTFLGPGTDLDVGGVYQAGRSIIDGNYQVSRLPGAPVFEAVTGLLHAVGGSLLVNLTSVVMAVATALAVARLLQREGHPHASWFGLAVLINPFVWISGTSMVDYLWASALLLAGANFQLSRRWLPASLLYALAGGCRLSTLLLVAAVIVADGAANAEVRRQLALLGFAVGALTAIIFVPPFVQLGTDFLRSDIPVSTLLIQVGRFGVKNTFFFGPVVIALVLWHLPRVVKGLPATWASSTVLRFGIIGFVASQLLFLRFPWKLAHLIPSLLCLVLVLAAARVLSRRSVGLLLGAQVLLLVVAVNPAQPDRPNEATGAELGLELVEGQWLSDLRCRLDSDRTAYRQPESLDLLLETWACVVPWSE